MSETVTTETSVILVPTASIINPYIIYLPSLSLNGKIVTIRDNDGMASTSNQILISTIGGVTFADGSSSISITNAYGFVTVTTNSQSIYSVINTYGFSNISSSKSVETTNLSGTNYIDHNNLVTTSVTSNKFYVNGANIGDVTNRQLQSTVIGLGTFGYISTLPFNTLTPTVYTTGKPGINGSIRSSIQYLNTPDITQWSGVTPVDGNGLFGVEGNAILYGNYMLVAVGQDNQLNARGNIQYSYDGLNWYYSESPMLSSNELRRQVSYGNGLWHTVGVSQNNNYETILYSRNGRGWNYVNTNNPLSNAYGIAYGQGVWVAIGAGEQTPLTWSRDGLNWATPISPITSTIKYTSSTSILCPTWPWPYEAPPAPPSDCKPCVPKKPPKKPKIIIQSTIANYFTSSVIMGYDVAYDGTKFIAVVSTLTPVDENIIYSMDGSNWSSSNVTGATVNSTWQYIYGNGNMWIATGTGLLGNPPMSCSTDGGYTWISVNQFTNSGYSFKRPYWDGVQWWVGQVNGFSRQSIWSSGNGINWSQTTTQGGFIEGGVANGFTRVPPIITSENILRSTVIGLGTAGYVSSAQYLEIFSDIQNNLVPLTQSNLNTYNCTRFDQSFIVPGNISTLDFFMWGAGGGGASGGIDTTLSGGGGAYLSGRLIVNPFDAITVVVGQGGLPGGFEGTMYGGGGAATLGGAGGGRTAINLNGIEIVTAGGGGGQGVRNDTVYAGGGAANADGSQSKQGYLNGGTGGSSTNPGIGAIDIDTGDYAQNGYYLTGGSALSYGGGGGGGYFGGGGGGVGPGTAGAQRGTGGGGGGSYYNSNYVINVERQNGNSGMPGGRANKYYVEGIGMGGTLLNPGGNGLIVFYYTTIAGTLQISPNGKYKQLYIENLTTNEIQVEQPTSPLYVATGLTDNINSTIQYSTDGIHWTGVTNGFNLSRGKNIKYNGSYWLAVGYDLSNGAIKYSQDGSNWINSGIGVFTLGGGGIAWNGQYWVAVGNNSGNSPILYSYDGFTWLSVMYSSPVSGFGTNVAWNGECWVAVGANGFNIKYSYDGSNWTDSTYNPIYDSVVGHDIAWNGEYWVLAASQSLVFCSYDGITWSDYTLDIDGAVLGVAWNGNYWLATCQDSMGNTIQVSIDGSNWYITLYGQNIMNNAPTTQANSVIWDGSKWFITGTDSGIQSIKYSGKNVYGTFIWIDAVSGGFDTQCFSVAFNTPQSPYLKNTTIALYNRTNTQPLYDTPSKNFIKTSETCLNINNTLYVNISTIASTNVTYFNSRVGIFEQSPFYTLELGQGDAAKPGGGSWAMTSDRRIKENIQDANLEVCASTLATLSLQNYSYTSSFINKTQAPLGERYGLIAQEVEIPNTVQQRPGHGYEDFHYLNIDQIHYIHMATTQYLIEKMTSQQSTIDGLLELI